MEGRQLSARSAKDQARRVSPSDIEPISYSRRVGLGFDVNAWEPVTEKGVKYNNAQPTQRIAGVCALNRLPAKRRFSLGPLARKLECSAFFALAVLLFASWLYATEANRYPYTGVILGYDTNVRAGSNLNYEIVTKLQKGDLVYIAGNWREWLKIRCPEGTVLWISGDFIEDGVIEANKLNVRSGPDLKYNVICQVLRDQKVDVVKKSGDGKWDGIKPPEDAYLWVHKDLVDKKGGPDLYGEFQRRREEVRKRLSKVELARELNMRKNTAEIPFEKMITEYETIAGDYPDFADEAKLASKRAEELRAAKKRLDEKIFTEEKAAEEETTKQSFEPRYVTAKGTLTVTEGKAGGQGILKLEDGDKPVCMVKSKTIELKQYIAGQVQVWGIEEYSSSWDVPLIEVNRVKRIK